jgi:hypothetical protein
MAMLGKWGNYDCQLDSRMKQPGLISEIPDYINSDLWSDFIQHRKEIRHKLTPTTEKFLLKKLAKLHQKGADVNLSITQTIENGWQGIFEYEINRRPQNGNGQRETAVQRSERIEDEALGISH